MKNENEYRKKLKNDAKNDNVSLTYYDLKQFDKLNRIFSGSDDTKGVTTKNKYPEGKYKLDLDKIKEYRQKPEYNSFFDNLKSQGLSYLFIKSEAEKLVKILRELEFVKDEGDSGFIRAAWNRIFPAGNPNHISQKSLQKHQKNIVETIDIENKEQSNIEWRQIIFFGTPGSGKSHKVRELIGEAKKKERVHRTTFHPDYDYSTFVGSYKPCPGDSDKKEPAITYKFEEQIFMKAYVAAWDVFCKGENEPIWLVIEEINRGNCAQIFGDIFQLLDRDSNGFSKFSINCCKEVQQWLQKNETYQKMKQKKGKIVPDDSKLQLPPTLSIVATMNTSDQSLFPMDSAFKRRWSWEYVPTIPILEDGQEPDPALEYLITLECSDKEYEYKWIDFIKTVNKKILELTSSEDKQLGAHFITDSVKTDEFSGKVMFYLWNDICKDEFRGNNGNFMKSKGKEFSFNELYEGNREHRGEILKGFMEELGVKSLQDEAEKTSAEKDTIPGASEGTAEKQ